MALLKGETTLLNFGPVVPKPTRIRALGLVSKEQTQERKGKEWKGRRCGTNTVGQGNHLRGSRHLEQAEASRGLETEWTEGQCGPRAPQTEAMEGHCCRKFCQQKKFC